jgi:hypothetical protein
MTTLSKKEKKRVRKFVQMINTQIEEEKEKSLQKFLLSHIDFIKDFTLPYESDTNNCRHASHLATPRILIWPVYASTLGHHTHSLCGHFFFLMRI